MKHNLFERYTFPISFTVLERNKIV